jgi:hypothetical protein
MSWAGAPWPGRRGDRVRFHLQRIRQRIVAKHFVITVENQSRAADHTGTMDSTQHPDPDSTPGLDLDALRARLRAARADRGACPPWEELRADLLPGGSRRVGRDERLAHRELCPYCDAHVREWERSIDRTADTLAAVEQHIARGVVDGALRLITLNGSRGAGSAPEGPAPPPAPPVPDEAPAPAPASWNAPPPVIRRAEPARPAPVPPAPRATPPPPPAPPREAPAMLRLLVVEAVAVERIPPSVFLCAEVLGAEVAHVACIDELAGDPDLEAVCAIVFAGARPAAEWPEAVRRGKDLAPGRPVVILAGGGAMLGEGARRALGSALLSDDDPAERLLLALDPRLR